MQRSKMLHVLTCSDVKSGSATRPSRESVDDEVEEEETKKKVGLVFICSPTENQL